MKLAVPNRIHHRLKEMTCASKKGNSDFRLAETQLQATKHRLQARAGHVT